jgi:hypothetical protein
MRDRRTLEARLHHRRATARAAGIKGRARDAQAPPHGGPIVCRAPNGLCSDAGELGCRDDLLVGVDHA